jgi:deazaflavin-dependent oxidoreductase (nitroreductase family)
MQRSLQAAGAWLGNLAARPRVLQVSFTRNHARVLRLARGRIRRSLLFAGGQPVLVLTTTGRRSGRRHSTPVAYLREGDDLVITGGNIGLDRPPAWSLNLQADPRAEVELEGKRLSVRARRAEGDERDRLWNRLIERFGGLELATRMTSREIPVIVLEPID